MILNDAQAEFLADVVHDPGLVPSTPRERQIARELRDADLVEIDTRGCVEVLDDHKAMALLALAAHVRKVTR